MKTSFTTVAFLLSATFPGSLIAKFAGLPLPAMASPGATFGLAVAALTLLIAFSDYVQHSTAPVLAAGPSTGDRTSAMAPASPSSPATEERRLAA